VPDDELAAAYGAGLTATEVVEVVAEVSLGTFTNYLNRLARPELDFPPVAMGPGSTANDIAA
jgi:alkylhydroperoxidase family enzyme